MFDKIAIVQLDKPNVPIKPIQFRRHMQATYDNRSYRTVAYINVTYLAQRRMFINTAYIYV